MQKRRQIERERRNEKLTKGEHFEFKIESNTIFIVSNVCIIIRSTQHGNIKMFNVTIFLHLMKEKRNRISWSTFLQDLNRLNNAIVFTHIHTETEKERDTLTCALPTIVSYKFSHSKCTVCSLAQQVFAT